MVCRSQSEVRTEKGLPISDRKTGQERSVAATQEGQLDTLLPPWRVLSGGSPNGERVLKKQAGARQRKGVQRQLSTLARPLPCSNYLCSPGSATPLPLCVASTATSPGRPRALIARGRPSTTTP